MKPLRNSLLIEASPLLVFDAQKKKKTLNFVNQKLKYFKIPRSRLHMDSREAAEEIIYQVDDELIDKEAMESIADRSVAAED